MTTRPHRTALALAAGAALVATAACGNGDATETETLDPPVPVTPEGEDVTPDDDGTGTATTDAPDDAATDDAPDSGAGGAVPPEYEGVLAAIDLAVAEHEGAQAFELDDNDDGWEVDVAVGDEEIEVRVSADGTQILSSERDGSVDSDDRAGLDAAGGFTLAEAVRAAITEYGGTAPVDDASISDEDGGTFAWEVGFTDDVEVYLDIATGEVLRVETD